MTDESQSSASASASRPEKRRSKSITKTLIFLRRVHLYTGLFLLPWVFLYGITGAMFNHQGLFAEAEIIPQEPTLLREAMANFPEAEALANDVVEELRRQSPESEIELAEHPSAAFNNPMIFKVQQGKRPHMVHIDPVSFGSKVVIQPENLEAPQPLLENVKNLSLSENPYQIARAAVPTVMEASGFDSQASVAPQGWCKLNFLAKVDGELARVTYVLRDGHVDTMKYKGEDGMTPRAFFLRLHTSHGQPPNWNARMLWSLVLDIMAIAMVTWGITGVVMWWQLKRTRVVGTVVIAASVVCAAALYFGMMNYYATTML